MTRTTGHRTLRSSCRALRVSRAIGPCDISA